MKRLIPLLLLAPLFTGCVADSQSYKAIVATTYPTVANRMERYDLSNTERQDVQTLREVSADRNKVTYTTARPAWENVAPSYRGHVAADAKLSAFVKNEWQLTADKLDQAQAEEAKYRHTLFGGE